MIFNCFQLPVIGAILNVLRTDIAASIDVTARITRGEYNEQRTRQKKGHEKTTAFNRKRKESG